MIPRRKGVNEIRNTAQLKNDHDLKLLRDHEGFKKLLAELESTQPAPPEPKPQPPKG